ncbi:FtsX-like permease family protein [Limibacter armeniacum]|uniref:ABC transporter permease n=1 Tax=Limibacter armeniacum TaxID=466084 RepID=UPI002FE544EA
MFKNTDMLAKLSWRNVWRNKPRSILIMFGIAFGIAAGVFALAMSNGIVQQRLREAIETETSHIQIHTPDFIEEQRLKAFLPNESQVTGVLEKNKVEAFSERTVVSGMLASANGNAGVQINGIVPEDEVKVTIIHQKLLEGDYFKKHKKNSVLISAETARKMKLKLRSKVVLTMQDINGELVGGAFRVVGIFKTNNTAYDKGNVFVLRNDLQRLVVLPEIHEVAIKVSDVEQVPMLVSQLKAELPSLKVQSWKEVQPELAYFSESTVLTNMIVLGIIMVALAFGILNTMLMAIFERVQEIGVLMAVGMARWRIFLMIVLETVYLGIVGGVVGSVVSYLLVTFYNHKGIDLSQFSQGFNAIGFGSMVYPEVGNDLYIVIGFLVVITALLASIYPARKALSLKPNEAIRGHA